MAKVSSIYGFVELDQGDIWYPGYDRRNMIAAENEIAGLMEEVGPGVIDGWDVTVMSPTTGIADLDAAITSEQAALIAAYASDPTSYLGRQYASLGQPATSNAWRQVIRVTPGHGIVGLYRARTDETAYFRFSTNNLYYVWAQFSPCLPREGKATIVAPLDPQEDYDTRNIATFLAQVEVATDVGISQSVVLSIDYLDRRNDLKNLAGALNAALQKAFYRHHHLGLINTPSKIKLDSERILNAAGPLGSTIFHVIDSTGATVIWKDSDYGTPIVRLNNNILPKSSYTLVSSSGTLYLKNSLPAGAALQVILPLSPQVNLSVRPPDSGKTNDIASAPTYLTDGVSAGFDADGNNLGPRIFRWDPGSYLDAQVYLRGLLQPVTQYTIDPGGGTISFSSIPSAPSGQGAYSNTDLSVVLTHIGIEIQGLLPGKRIGSMDAGAFSRGTLSQTRMAGLSHIGQTRFKDTAVLIPTHRLIAEGDHVTFYPQLLDTPLQFNMDVFASYLSQNLVGAPILLGGKRGLYQTSDGISPKYQPTWNRDQGQPIFFIDEVHPSDPVSNPFHTTFLLTKEGSVYATLDGGSSWTPVRMPSIAQVSGAPVIPQVLSFWASTQRDEVTVGVIVKEKFTSQLYLGTTNGLYTFQKDESITLDRVAWPAHPSFEGHSVQSVMEIVTADITVTQGDTKTSDTRSVYAGTDSGFYVNGSLLTSDIVRGFYWIRAGAANNNLIWWTADSVYITHTAEFHEDSDSTSDHIYWVHPLTGLVQSKRYTDVDASSTGSNINVTGGAPATLDGVAMTSGKRAVLRDQTDPAQNGVYIVSIGGPSGTWTKDVSISLANSLWVKVTGGATYAGSAWKTIVSGSTPVYGTSPVAWQNLWYRAMYDASADFRGVYPRAGYSEYFVLAADGVRLIADRVVNGVWLPPFTGAFSWLVSASNLLGSPQTMIRLPGAEAYLIATPRGLWTASAITDGLTANSIAPAWTVNRPRQEFFDSAPKLTLFDQKTGAVITDSWASSQSRQSIVFAGARAVDASFLYEKDYKKYWTNPWTGSTADVPADVIVYVDGIEVTYSNPYQLFPDQGLIQFTNSQRPGAIVQITIVRNGAYLKNTGTVPHEEVPNSFVTAPAPLTTLNRNMLPADLSFFVTDFGSLPPEATYLELRSPTARERLAVRVDPVTASVELQRPRSGQNTFFATVTQVFLVTQQTIPGIEDLISQQASNENYHFNSLTGDNLIQSTVGLKAVFPSLFGQWTSATDSNYAYQKDEGPKNALFFDFSNSNIDTRGSNSNLSVGVSPSPLDVAQAPHTVYAISPVTPPGNGVGLRTGTDRGIWRYDTDNAWHKESDLGGAARVYFFGSSNGLIAGTDQGLYFQNGDNTWSLDASFPQAIFDYASGSWGDTGNYQAWGKEDGLAFVYQAQTGAPFTSDHFNKLDGKRVYGLHHNKFIRLSTDASGDTVQTKIDALYLCTEYGLWGLTFGDRAETFSSLLTGREMFGGPLSGPATSDGSSRRYYRIFQSQRLNSIPLIILTSDGVLVVRNWRWCDPADGAGLVFVTEANSLPGVSCTCFAQATGTSPVSGETIYKIFIGTDQGVFRSYNDGYSWERCERIVLGKVMPVYDVKIVGTSLNGLNSVLMVGTDSGLYYSNDDGDSWYRTDANPSDVVYFDPNVGAQARFDINSGTHIGAIGQTFTPPSGYKNITKVDVYLSLRPLADPVILAAAQSNWISADIYALSGGLPTGTSLGTSTDTLLASAVNFPTFYSFRFPPLALPGGDPDGTAYAVVLTEHVVGGAANTSIFQWSQSTQASPYANGSAITLASGGTWSLLTGKDFFFRVAFDSNPSPIETRVDIDFKAGSGRGFCVNDNGTVVNGNAIGQLTTDFKLALTMVVDESRSLHWSDPGNHITAKLPAFFDAFWSLTQNTVTLNSVGYAFNTSYADIWIFGVTEKDRSSGYINDLNALKTITTALYERGYNSSLYDTTQVAISGLNPQSIADSLLVPGSTGNTLRVAILVQYLQNKSMLRLSDIVAWWQALPNPSAWDQTAATIANYDDVSSYVVNRWARTCTPCIVIVTDGDDSDSADPANVVIAAQSAWDEAGVPVYAFALGRSHEEGNLRLLTDATGGKVFDITNGNSSGDWEAALSALQIGGSDVLDVALWSQAFDYDAPVWIRKANVVYTIPSAPGGYTYTTTPQVLVQLQYTFDRIHWSPWIALTSGTDLVIDQPLLGLKYQIVLKDGLAVNGSLNQKMAPVVNSLYHVTVTPSRKYLVTPPYSTPNVLFETLLSAAVDLPHTAQTNWGIVRGSSTDFADFEPVLNNSKWALANRQQSLYFTPVVTRSRLSTTTSDFTIYQVVDDRGNAATWTDADTVIVYAGLIPYSNAQGAYSLDGKLGLVEFASAQPSTLSVFVTIVSASTLVVNTGEPMTTRDGKTYFAANGRWPYDATVIVLVNGAIIRGGYWLAPNEGTVTFAKERARTDIVSLFVQHSSTWRVGVEVVNYGSSDVSIHNFGLYYSTQRNTRVLFDYNHTQAPVVSNVVMNPSAAPTIYNRLYLTYTFHSKEGSQESGTVIHWYKKRSGTISEITSPNYQNRTTEREIDAGSSGIFIAGDEVWATVTPSDGIKTGALVESTHIVLADSHAPYVNNLRMQVGTAVVTTSVHAGLAISALYDYHDLDGGTDQSTIIWYLKDDYTTPFWTGATIPDKNTDAVHCTQSKQVLSFVVYPYDGTHHGTAVFSDNIVVQ